MPLCETESRRDDIIIEINYDNTKTAKGWHYFSARLASILYNRRLISVEKKNRRLKFIKHLLFFTTFMAFEIIHLSRRKSVQDH